MTTFSKEKAALRWDSNPRLTHSRCEALPTELLRQLSWLSSKFTYTNQGKSKAGISGEFKLSIREKASVCTRVTPLITYRHIHVMNALSCKCMNTVPYMPPVNADLVRQEIYHPHSAGQSAKYQTLLTGMLSTLAVYVCTLTPLTNFEQQSVYCSAYTYVPTRVYTAVSRIPIKGYMD